MMYRSIKFFTDGFKPAILFENKADVHVIKKFKEDGYPFTTRITGRTLFFHTLERCDQFIEDMDKALKGIKNPKEQNRIGATILGEYLGIPPSAVQFYADSNKQSWLTVDFYGLAFNTVPELLDENLKWLKSKYKLPANYEGSIVITDNRPTNIELEYNDINRTKLVKAGGIIDRHNPIFNVTIVRKIVREVSYGQVIRDHLEAKTKEDVLGTIMYSGHNPSKALSVFNRNKKAENIISVTIEVWINDKMDDIYTEASIDVFRKLYIKK